MPVMSDSATVMRNAKRELELESPSPGQAATASGRGQLQVHVDRHSTTLNTRQCPLGQLLVLR